MKRTGVMNQFNTPICVLIIMIGIVMGKSTPNGFEHIESSAGIEEYKMSSNGLTVLLMEDYSAPVVTFMVTYHVGSRNEAIGHTGSTHLLEHLMFKGTKKLKPGEFSKIVSINGGKENAFTSKNYTGYFQLIHKSKLELIMSLEADRMKNIKLIEKEFENEKTVVLEERYSRINDNPSALLSEQINASLYMNHPYRKPIIGWEHEIKNLNLDDVMKFYEKYYAPNNAIIVICGDVNLDEIVNIQDVILIVGQVLGTYNLNDERYSRK